MFVFSPDFWQTLLTDPPVSSSCAYFTLLPAILVLGQLLVSSARALRKISFASYGLSFHSRYVANVNFMTNANGVIGSGYKKVGFKNFKRSTAFPLTTT